MNKLTKVGLSALCGSLASVAAANAGTLEVLGGATATWSSNTGQVSGNPIGLSSGITFKGSGELDNGSTFTLTLTGADQDAYSSGSLSIATPSLGTISVSQATGGNGLGGYDDKMPTAWEESWGTSLGAGIDLPKGVASSMNIGYSSPTVLGTTLKLAYSPRNDGALVNDKAAGGSQSSYKQGGYDVVLDMNPSFGTDVLSGLNVFVAGSRTEIDKEAGLSAGNTADNHEEGLAGVIYAFGPVKLGYQRSIEMSGLETAGTTSYYQNNAFGVSFNVNDNLSISYGEMESTKHVTNNTGNNKRTTTAESIQLAYTMGGLSLKIAETEVDDATCADGGTASDFEGTTLAMTLAF